jgi:hypothetical protein
VFNIWDSSMIIHPITKVITRYSLLGDAYEENMAGVGVKLPDVMRLSSWFVMCTVAPLCLRYQFEWWFGILGKP